ncbi:ATP-binding protein [Aliarcobacter butzleri]|uniref:ATP-binding protein n=1 Tax=Aliarcobacter butzleri TaxID=28197 RepID=UPI00125F03FB|nr:ATP-binding protein [Aliarcobacter butzleri]MCT7650373.1 ATP-binding protein [Aliarcobacter butzleri]
MKTKLVKPNLKNFIKSLRDIGYTFEIAVADILDNSISANATEVKIYTVPKPELVFYMLDNGSGMCENELLEAMRLATKNPDAERDKKDLGRFGLGLKTASFSQCKKLTVISKKNNQLSIQQWDLDYISEVNEWELITPELNTYQNIPFFYELSNSESGTLVIWEKIDKYERDMFSHRIEKLNSHLSLVFHRFLEGADSFTRLKISVNEHYLKPFDPFNSNHDATFEQSPEIINFYDSNIKITSFILPHHKNLSQEEWDRFGTEDGYIKSQGFYLYRANRLLIYGTWWGLHKASDAHKLVRIKIDILNNQDRYWGIDIKKSTANPLPELKTDLKRIIQKVTKDGFKPFSTRGRKINDKTITRFWTIIPDKAGFYFGINKEHPIYIKLIESLPEENKYLFNSYLKGLEAYLPLDSIQQQLQQNPHNIKQEDILNDNDKKDLFIKLKSLGLDKEYIESLLKTELYKNHEELLDANESI